MMTTENMFFRGPGRLVAILAVLAAAGCGEELAPLKPRVDALEKTVASADESAGVEALDDACTRYRSAVTAAEGLLADMVPGDENLEKVTQLRSRAAEGLADTRAKMLTKAARDAAPKPEPEMRGEPAANLLPLVAAYTPPPPPPEDGQGQPAEDGNQNSTGDGQRPTTGNTTTGGQITAPVEPPKPVRVTKVVLKPDGRTAIIYWRFTNVGAANQAVGAPMGYLLNPSGGELTSFRQHFLAEGFEFNEADPLASKGTMVTPESVQVGNGDSKELVTVGVTTQGKQAGGGKIVVRMADGTSPEDSMTSISKE